MRRSARAGLSVLCIGVGIGITACSSLGPHQDHSPSATAVPSIAALAAQATATPDAAHTLPPQARGLNPPARLVTPLPCTAATAAPTQVASFRLISGCVDANTLPHTIIGTPVPNATRAVSPADLRRSPLFHEPSWLPAGYTLTIFQEQGSDAPGLVLWMRFEGPRYPIDIYVSRILRLPVDVGAPESTADHENVLGQINGRTAIIYYGKGQSADADGLTFVYGDQLIGVDSTGGGGPKAVTIDELKRIAASLSLP